MTPIDIRQPDLSDRPWKLSIEHSVSVPCAAVYSAWTEGFDRWFADPGSVAMTPEVGKPFFFEAVHRPEGSSTIQRHPHYGRFLELETDRLVVMTWVSGAGGTEGAETVVRVEMIADATGCRVRLTHSGFPNEQARDRHAQAWPMVLAQMEQRLAVP
jgi:uncharacterized protein YndB with AHSA1/START domain